MNNDFYKQQNFSGSEIATVVGFSGDNVSLYLNTITPQLSGSAKKKKEVSKYSVGKVLNKSVKVNIKSVTIRNYVNAPIPSGISLSEGDKVVITFPGGELSKPRIVSKY